MTSLEENVTKAIKYYGESLLTEEGKIDCFKRYGYFVWEIAKERFLFNKKPHAISKEMKEKWEKEVERNLGTATKDTRLEF